VHVAPETLGPDLAGLIKGIDSRLSGVVRLTELHSSNDARGCYGLRFANGQTFKYRRMQTAERAEMLERLLSHLASPHIPRILARHGSGLLIEFVHGRRLQRSDQDHRLLEWCGALQGRIHSADTEGLDLTTWAPISEEASELEASIDDLVGRGALERAMADDLLALATGGPPQPAAGEHAGVIHRDFCAENILLGPSGRIHLVDNESIDVGPLDYDLARTWYRWPMGPRERAAYWKGYARFRDPLSFASSFVYWAVAVLVESALFRLEFGTPKAIVPLRRLRILLREARDGLPSDPHLR
jgi:aminoglycoside phosphotransferase (APT) family kinase protein